MRVAVATDQDAVASGFGCCPFWTILDIDGDRIHQRLLIPNPGASHDFWSDLFFRNSVEYVIVGAMGAKARSVMLGKGIKLVLGVSGAVEDVLRQFAAGALQPAAAAEARPDGCCGTRG
jgi:predicted Fe-Mo cluster-binding NifX family protein